MFSRFYQRTESLLYEIKEGCSPGLRQVMTLRYADYQASQDEVNAKYNDAANKPF